MRIRTCYSCKHTGPESDFTHRRGVYRNYCMTCERARIVKVRTKYRKVNPYGIQVAKIRYVLKYVTRTPDSKRSTPGADKYCINSNEIRRNLGIRPAGYTTDHIIPLCWFRLDDYFELSVANDYRNLQYLTMEDNDSKGDNEDAVNAELEKRPELANLWALVLAKRDISKAA